MWDKSFEVYGTITDCTNKGEPVNIAYIDFSKAYDKILHERLI